MTLSELTKYHTVTRDFMPDILELKRLFDFIPKVQGKSDQLILRRWEADFQARNIPYVVTEAYTDPKEKKAKKTYTLWKEEVESMVALCK